MNAADKREALVRFITARLDDLEAVAPQAAEADGDDPDRVLRDITARRWQLIHLSQLADRNWSGSYTIQEEAIDGLMALAVPFELHPDYLPEFKPRWA